jgi:hypothetical protein
MQIEIDELKERRGQLETKLADATVAVEAARADVIAGKANADKAAITAQNSQFMYQTSISQLQREIDGREQARDGALRSEQVAAGKARLVSLAAHGAAMRSRYEETAKRMASALEEHAANLVDEYREWMRARAEFVNVFRALAGPGILLNNNLQGQAHFDATAACDALIKELEAKGVDLSATTVDMVGQVRLRVGRGYEPPDDGPYGPVVALALDVATELAERPDREREAAEQRARYASVPAPERPPVMINYAGDDPTLREKYAAQNEQVERAAREREERRRSRGARVGM